MVIPKIDAPFTEGAQIEARAQHPDLRDREFLVHDHRSWSYSAYRDRCLQVADFLLKRLAAGNGPPHVAMMLENHLELLSLFGGCAYAGMTLFGINTGLLGDTL